MHTYILTDETVDAYLRDFLQRMVALEGDMPTTWCTIGASGDKLMAAVLALAPTDFIDRLDIRRLRFDRTAGTMIVADEADADSPFPPRVALIDGPIHSGATMTKVGRHLRERSVREIVSYGLAVKRSSEFIPTFFGLMIGEHDRVYFQLREIPNHRLQSKPPFGVLRAICEADATAPLQTITTGTSLDQVALADLWYERRTRGDHSYVYEVEGEFAGFVHFFQPRPDRVFIDAIANATIHQGKGIGGALLRWVENWARNHRCVAIDLYAIADKIDFYRRFGYEALPEPPLVLGVGEKQESFHKMSRRLLYNIDPNLAKAC